MRTPISKVGTVIVGIGVGIFVFSGFASYPPATTQFMSGVGVALMAVGFILGFYNAVAFRRQVHESTVQTTLDAGEQILQVFPGGHRFSKFSASMGKWCITNRRLIYEGSIPRVLSSETDFLSFSLKDLAKLEIITAGTLDRFLEVTFTNESTTETVQIVGRKLEESRDTLQRAAGTAS